MALSDDINALPTTVADGNTGHTSHHQTIHAALKSFQTRIGTVEGRVPAAVTVDTSFGTRVNVGNTTVYGATDWYDITSMLSPAPTSGTLLARRTNGWLLLQFSFLAYSADVSATLTLPLGWRSVNNDGGTLLNTSSSPVGRARLTYGGALTLTFDATSPASNTLSFPTKADAPWPTAAPTAGA